MMADIVGQQLRAMWHVPYIFVSSLSIAQNEVVAALLHVSPAQSARC